MSGVDPVAGAAGTIYDIGYQRYEGVRLGRGNALRTLTAHGLRTIFGIGRGERAKVAPFALVALAVVPAVVQAWVAAATGDLVRLIEYHTYFQQIEFIFLLFCAAQAPELVSTDQQNRVLPLYFSRPLRAEDYALSRLVALFGAIFAIGLAGQLILFSGRVFGSEVLLDGWRAERGAVLPILATTAAGALLMATVSLAVASLVRARAIASAAVLGFFLVTGALAQILREALSAPQERYSVLISPLNSLAGFVYWLFEADPPRRSLVARAALPGYSYGIAIAAATALGLILLFVRYRRLRT